MAFFSIPRPISPSPPLLLTKCRPFFKSQITRVPASPTLLRHRIPPPPAASPELEAVEEDEKFPTPLLEEESDVAASVEVLKAAAKTRKAPPAQVLAALASIKKGKAEPSSFLETLGGTESPGRTWMLIFTAQGKLDKGRYFPITAVQRFDAAGLFACTERKEFRVRLMLLKQPQTPLFPAFESFLVQYGDAKAPTIEVGWRSALAMMKRYSRELIVMRRYGREGMDKVDRLQEEVTIPQPQP
ncbi:hypothetical protein ZIOFF_069276 [Zingiber officinale]|uniref:Uncharacterized protein n=1 Tax=Zingiber officinale TaxID=94328 RepID=A0A8J5EV22_ZINOF|nr:hypothetical protein ZIOFF_069276 [Zingiber officinale]